MGQPGMLAKLGGESAVLWPHPREGLALRRSDWRGDDPGSRGATVTSRKGAQGEALWVSRSDPGARPVEEWACRATAWPPAAPVSTRGHVGGPRGQEERLRTALRGAPSFDQPVLGLPGRMGSSLS